MTKTLVIWICYLFPELLADAFVLLCPFQTAGTVSAGTF